jgi:hypothetical protein
MTDSYQEYLAANVIAESRPVRFMHPYQQYKKLTVQVTYRLLSRAVKVKVNIAKQ